MIDFWELSKDFKPGCWVQRFIPGLSGLSPFIGTVLKSHPGLGVVDVQWPQSVERLTPDELVIVNPEMARYLPPSLNNLPNTEDSRRAALNSSLWGSLSVPFWHRTATLWNEGNDELEAYNRLYGEFSDSFQDADIRHAVQRFYTASRKLADLRLNHHINKVGNYKAGAYWVQEGRRYRVSKGEIQAKCPNCPKCGGPMRKSSYKMDKGSRVRLFACPKDLFLIKFEHLQGPDGEPVEW